MCWHENRKVNLTLSTQNIWTKYRLYGVLGIETNNYVESWHAIFQMRYLRGFRKNDQTRLSIGCCENSCPMCISKLSESSEGSSAEKWLLLKGIISIFATAYPMMWLLLLCKNVLLPLKLIITLMKSSQLGHLRKKTFITPFPWTLVAACVSSPVLTWLIQNQFISICSLLIFISATSLTTVPKIDLLLNIVWYSLNVWPMSFWSPSVKRMMRKPHLSSSVNLCLVK